MQFLHRVDTKNMPYDDVDWVSLVCVAVECKAAGQNGVYRVVV